MTNPIPREPPIGAPEGTVWFGGPVDRWRVTFRVHGPQLDPDAVSELLGCEPSVARRAGNPRPKQGSWRLKIDSRECLQNTGIDDGIKMLLARLPSDRNIWTALTTAYEVDVFCGIFLEGLNRGFEIPAEVSHLLSERNLTIGFDVYFDPPDQQRA